VLDLPIYQRLNTWTSTIRSLQLLGEDRYGNNIEFTHIIELQMEDEEIKLRAEHMRMDPTDGKVYSRWEREERKKPRPEPDDENEV